MPTLREYLQSLSPSGKKTTSGKQMAPLMDRIRDELSSEHPDYSLCLDALALFPAQVTGMFYSNVYPSLSETVQKEWNQAFLKWADSQPPENKKQQAAFLRMSQAIKARLKQMKTADELSLEIQWFVAHFADNGKRATSDTRDMKDKVSAEQLRKLLVLPVENWPVDKESLRTFFAILFADFPAERLEKEYRMFLMRTGLDADGHGDSLLSEAEPRKEEDTPHTESLPEKPVSKEESVKPATERAALAEEPEKAPVEQETAEQSVSATSAATPSKAAEQSAAESSTRETASPISVESPESSQATPSATEQQAGAETSTEISPKQTVPETPPSKSAENTAQQPQSSGTSGKANEPGLLKLLERALASAKQEVRNTEKLACSQKQANERIKKRRREKRRNPPHDSLIKILWYYYSQNGF